jgi:hypothetical protein
MTAADDAVLGCILDSARAGQPLKRPRDRLRRAIDVSHGRGLSSPRFALTPSFGVS